MKTIQTGKGTIPLMTLIAIWSISLVVNLPGLAISPMLGELHNIFPSASELEVQLLTILPNLLIIPFVLISGHLSVSKSKMMIVVVSLIIYLSSGLLYLFASTMTELIIVSCLLGVGCGLLIPLAAGLIADTFTGKYRLKQLGIKSGIANISLVMATFIVGWLGGHNWHLPFLVYLLPVIPLLLTAYLRHATTKASIVENSTSPIAPGTSLLKEAESRFHIGRILGIMGMYFFVSYCVLVVSFYLPFLMQTEKMSDSALGTVTSLFFLAVFLPGFFLTSLVRIFRQSTLPIAAAMLAVGLIIIIITHSAWIIGAGVFLMGFGYGIFQPVIYDKATQTIVSERDATLALSFVLAINYLAITLSPFIVDFFSSFVKEPSAQFPFLLNFVMAILFIVIIIIYRRSFVFSIDKNYL
ncbi:MAG: MFS transporter [Bacteroidaceae bacterium]